MEPTFGLTPQPQSHSGAADPGEWWACQQPERPAESDWTMFDLRCRPCVLAAHVAVRHLAPDRGIDIRTAEDPDGDNVVLVAEAAKMLPSV